MAKHYDVVVLGAGIGALTAAALLARRSWRVLVLGQGWRPPDLPVRRRDARAPPLHVPRRLVAGVGPRARRARAVADVPAAHRRRSTRCCRCSRPSCGSMCRRTCSSSAARSTASFPRCVASSTSCTPSWRAPTPPPTPPSSATSSGRPAASGSGARPRAFAASLPTSRGTLGAAARRVPPRPRLPRHRRRARALREPRRRTCRTFAVARLHGAWTRGVVAARERRARARRLSRGAPARARRRGAPRRARRARRAQARASRPGSSSTATTHRRGSGFVATDHTTRALLNLANDFESAPAGARALAAPLARPNGASWSHRRAKRGAAGAARRRGLPPPAWPHRGHDDGQAARSPAAVGRALRHCRRDAAHRRSGLPRRGLTAAQPGARDRPCARSSGSCRSSSATT